MTDDDFEDILDQVHALFPLVADDPYARAEYQRLLARVSDTGGEEQRAQLQELIDDLERQAEDEREENRADADEEF